MIALDSSFRCCRDASSAVTTAAQVFVLSGLLSLFSTSLFADDETVSSSTAAETLPLITPFNFDPGEHSRRGGLVSTCSVATGRIWNRLLPRVCFRKKPTAEPLLVLDPQTRQLGKSVLGLPIVGHFFGVTGPKTLIFAAIHGDEPNTAFVANQLVEHLIKSPEAYFARRVGIVPVVNPDGLARGTRINAREIDLNRNFPAKNFAIGKKGRYFGGEQPASEPETQLLIDLIEDWQPNRIISMHAIARGKHGNNFDGPAEELAKTMSRHNEYSVLKSMGYPTPGSFGSWAGIDRQLPTITLELPSDAAGSIAWRENREALLSAIQAK